MGYVKRNRHTGGESRVRRILRDARLAKGVRQGELAEKLHARQSFVSKYESGERMLTFSETVDICQALGFPPAKLLREYLRHET
jgi:transcriptional regulator with XRE-family HTH domain